jgi:hypothetical protein
MKGKWQESLVTCAMLASSLTHSLALNKEMVWSSSVLVAFQWTIGHFILEDRIFPWAPLWEPQILQKIYQTGMFMHTRFHENWWLVLNLGTHACRQQWYHYIICSLREKSKLKIIMNLTSCVIMKKHLCLYPYNNWVDIIIASE